MFEQNVTFLSYRTQCSITYAKKKQKNIQFKAPGYINFLLPMSFMYQRNTTVK